MKNDKYIPNFYDTNNKKVLGNDVTETVGKCLANKILSEPIINKMNFPRLRFPLLSGYKTIYYQKIANFILSKDITVYEADKDAKINFFGVYLSGSNQFIFSPKLTKNFENYMGTVIHEMTHAIQDLKKWRDSDRDREVDGHFAAAYFMVLKNKEFLLKASRYNDFINLAKTVKEDPKYFSTIKFRTKVRKLQNTISVDYNTKFKYDIEKIEDFQKRNRMDGIGN